MKIIKLFLLLSLGLWADYKQHIPDESEVDTKLLQNVVENGWSDTNETLNLFIIKYKDKALPVILQIIDHPLRKVEPTKDNVDPLPEMRLTIRDYWNLLSYMKYLEHIGESEKVLHIYTQIFEGLNNIEDRLLISMIYRIEIEKITVNSLKQALKNHCFTQEQKNILKQRIAETLLLDTQIFFEALEAERKGIVRGLAKSNTFQEDFGKEVLEKVDFLLKSYNKELFSIKTKQELEEHEKKFKEVKEEFLEIYNQRINNKNTPREKVVNLVAGFIIFEGALNVNGAFNRVKIDLWKNIEANHKLLEKLN